MMVVHIVTQDPTEMFLIGRYHVVQNLAAATSDPTLGYPVLPGRPHTRSFRLQTCRRQEARHLGVELPVPIQDDVPIWTGLRKGLPQLLHDPLRSGMLRYIAVENLAPFMLDDKEAIQYAERHGRHCEEVHCDDHLAMVLQEGQPFLIGVSATNNPAQISGYAPLGDAKAELLQFRVDFGNAPIGILVSQTAD